LYAVTLFRNAENVSVIYSWGDEEVSPTITSTNNKTVKNGTGGTFQVTATGTAPITYSLANQPDGVSIDITSGLIAIDATTAKGVYIFTITASNGVLPNAMQSFTLTVNELGEVPPTGITDITGLLAAMFMFILISAALWGLLLRPKFSNV
jgi:hypothetical protein